MARSKTRRIFDLQFKVSKTTVYITLGIVLVFLFLLALYLLTGGKIFSGITNAISQSGLGIGMITLNCQNMTYLSSSNTQYPFTCNFIATNNGQTGVFAFNNASVQSDGVSLNNNGNFYLDTTQDACKYYFDNTSYPVYQYSVDSGSTTQSNGYYVCTSQIANPPFSSFPGYVGTTPISCSPNCQAALHPTISGCIDVYKKQIGSIYTVDPSLFYDYEVNISETVNGVVYNTVLSSLNKSVSTSYYQCQSPLTGIGAQACPTPIDVAVFVSSTPSSNPLSYIDANDAQQIINLNSQISGINSIITNNQAYTTDVNTMLSSSPNPGQYATAVTTPAQTYNTAAYEVIPSSSVATPLISCQFNLATAFGIHVPVGKPQIISVNSQPCQAGQACTVQATVTNNGDSTAFNFGLQCPFNNSVFTNTANVSSGATATVPITYTGAGFKNSCTVTMQDANNPQNIVSTNVTLTLNPYCGLNQPWPQSTEVTTQYGCAWICANYGNGTDVIDPGCVPIPSNGYDRCNYQTVNGSNACISQNSYAGYHCTGIGSYLTTNQYMDEVNSGTIQPFIQACGPYQYFITESNNIPVCQCVNQFGYSGGSPANVVFNPSLGYPTATPSSTSGSSSTSPPPSSGMGSPNPSSTSPSSNQTPTPPTTSPNGIPQVPVNTTSGLSTSTIIIGVALVFVILIVMLTYILLRKKTGKR